MFIGFFAGNYIHLSICCWHFLRRGDIKQLIVAGVEFVS